MSKKIVLITGSQGNVGLKLQKELRQHFNLKLLDRNSGGDTSVIVMDLSQWHHQLVDHCQGVDAIVHLAADPNESRTWGELIGPNIDALNNIFMAATLAHVPRLIFASSNHVMGGYYDEENRPGRWLKPDIEPRPGTHIEYTPGVLSDSTPYGSMKLFGEQLGLCYAKATPAVFLAIRIGWVNCLGQNQVEDLPANAPSWGKRMWLSTPDLCQLIQLSIETPFSPGTSLVLNGMSDNEGMVWDLEPTTTALGYKPQHGLTADLTKDKYNQPAALSF